MSEASQPAPRSAPYRLIDLEGNWTGESGPDLGDDELRRLYADMLAIQQLDERFTILVRTGKSSIMTSAAGHEAAHVGIARAIRKGVDWLFPYYRDHGLLFAYGVPPVELFGQMLATRVDPGKGRQTPTHVTCAGRRVFSMSSPVGSHLPVAVGAAMALARREPGAVVICTFGDGATSTGDFHGALTLAGVQRAPIVFVCENNRYALSVSLEDQNPGPTIASKAAGYGMPSYWMDGLDALAVGEAVATAVDAVRRGGGPALVELDLYRFGAHSSSDDDARYRTREEIERHRGRDAVIRYRRFLERRGLWTEAWETAVNEEIRSTLAAALHQATAAGAVPPQWMFDDVYAREPWHLAEQRQSLEQDLD